MATEVLRPQDVLAERFRVTPPSPFHHHQRRRNLNHNVNGNGNGNSYHKKKFNPQQQQQRHQELSHTKRYSGADEFKPARNTRSENFDTGNTPVVTILRRGESLDSLNSKIKKEGKRTTPPEMADVYAGSGFSVSPSPSSLPLPSFLKPFDDSATRDLRRLLRLD